MEIQNLKFFTYDQNNSGGSFHFDAEHGISTQVIVQARDAREANDRARYIGLYFDGAGDCSCCGDRWYEQYGEGYDTPLIYEGCNITAWMRGKYFMKWQAPDRPEVYVHLYDDRFMGFVYGGHGEPVRLFESTDVPFPADFIREIES